MGGCIDACMHALRGPGPAPAPDLPTRPPAPPIRPTPQQADFGLSKTLPINKHAEYGYLDSKFRLTGETGA